jgi:primosomal protein N'
VVDIDLSSQGHDLRGAEKNLQLYHQLSGRAGRTGKPATVYFQTYNTNTKMISDLTNSNPDIFLDRELDIRRQNKLPPFQRFISLILTGDNEIKLEKIINNEVQILVGTQLISKGFHFPSLNCIVVVDIDLSSQGHDLRGAEKNLQLYHQLSGRAGRTGKPATVYFQTYNTNTKMISDLTNSNPDIFLDRELGIRRQNKLPPFQRFISLILTGDNEIKLEKEAFYFKNFIEKKINGRVLGPVSAPIFKLKRKFRIRMLIRGSKSLKLQNSIAQIIPNYKFSSGIKLSVDVDPINFN